ncbi:MAG: SHOCT domain-containing protein [Lewinellaceae bacterium]|nr:SHOCT domain-containing protein [Saprospiraceae bacterium]MCB9341713.1 SHOCT domain-containing protein [Lewinellaceae bacterium]
MHFYEGYHFGGMHLFWWIIWIVLLIWVFATPWPIPGDQRKRERPLDILQRKYAAGEISTKEYEERKAILERDGTE